VRPNFIYDNAHEYDEFVLSSNIKDSQPSISHRDAQVFFQTSCLVEGVMKLTMSEMRINYLRHFHDVTKVNTRNASSPLIASMGEMRCKIRRKMVELQLFKAAPF
jgi:hypothetical protein